MNKYYVLFKIEAAIDNGIFDKKRGKFAKPMIDFALKSGEIYSVFLSDPDEWQPEDRKQQPDGAIYVVCCDKEDEIKDTGRYNWDRGYKVGRGWMDYDYGTLVDKVDKVYEWIAEDQDNEEWYNDVVCVFEEPDPEKEEEEDDEELPF